MSPPWLPGHLPLPPDFPWEALLRRLALHHRVPHNCAAAIQPLLVSPFLVTRTTWSSHLWLFSLFPVYVSNKWKLKWVLYTYQFNQSHLGLDCVSVCVLDRKYYVISIIIIIVFGLRLPSEQLLLSKTRRTARGNSSFYFHSQPPERISPCPPSPRGSPSPNTFTKH